MEITGDQKERLAALGVVLCYAHGSVARGTPMRESDLDIAVLFERAPEDPLTMMGEISDILAPLAPRCDLDVAILNETTPLFAQVVAVEGVVLYERSEDDRIRFEFRAMHEYEASRRIHRIAFRSVMTRPAPV